MIEELLGAAEIRQKLRRVARERKEDMQLVLGRYARERLLYRLGRSPYAEVFVLKGAMLFHLWSEELHRPTRDLDLLGFGESSVARLVRVFREVGAIEAEEDALQFDAAAIRGTVIREGQHDEGVPIRCLGLLGETRIPIQIDIGFGDAITPAARMVTYPTLLDLPPPVIRAYPAESVVAEKFQALVDLGSTNSRMKDFYDLWMLARTRAFDGGTLSRAIQETFSRRGTDLPDDTPIGFSAEWARGEQVMGYWRGFLERNGLTGSTPELTAVLPTLRVFLMPPTAALSAGGLFAMTWPPGGPWRERLGTPHAATPA